MGMIKDGRSQRWSLADSLGADAANGKKAAHEGHNGEPKGLRQGYGRIGIPGAAQRAAVRCRPGIVTNAGAWNGPGSALQHFVLQRARDTGLAQFSRKPRATVEGVIHSQYSLL